MSSEIIQLLNNLLRFFEVVIGGYIAYKVTQINTKAKESAVKTEEVAKKAEIIAEKVVKVEEVLATTSTESKELAKQTHSLVNSAFAVQLEINRIATQRVAEMPDATEDEKRTAALSAEALRIHNIHQERSEHVSDPKDESGKP